MQIAIGSSCISNLSFVSAHLMNYYAEFINKVLHFQPPYLVF